MDDPEGHEVRQSHLSCPTKAGAGHSAGVLLFFAGQDGAFVGCFISRDGDPSGI